MQRVEDPKVRVSLSLRRSTVEAIQQALKEGESVGRALSAAVESKYGR